MINDAGALADCFLGTPLAGRTVTARDMSESGEVLFEVEVDEAELVPVWSAARALLDRTGRWPAVNGFGIFGRPSIDVSTIDHCCEGDEDPGCDDEWRAEGEQSFSELREAQQTAWKPAPLEVRLTYQLRRTVARCGTAPEPPEVLRRLPTDVRDRELERCYSSGRSNNSPPLNLPTSGTSTGSSILARR